MTKIEALEKTIYNLGNDVYEYAWGDINKCNCGILARTITSGVSAGEAGYYSLGLVNEYGRVCAGFWGVVEMAYSKCQQTGEPLPRVFAALRDCGFSVDELQSLERCGREKYIVVAYLKNWLGELKPVKEPRVNVIYVAQTLRESVPVLN
jgi:hypothetical protein